MPTRPDNLVIQWHLSERCNLRCSHCYQGGWLGREEGLEHWLPRLEQFRAFLRDGQGGRPIPAHITLTGGEPFALKQFPELLDAMAQHRQEFSFAILSNGTLIDAAMARRLRQWAPGYVQVSLDGVEATHDAIRGAGNFARAVAGIRALVAAGIHTLIAFTAQKTNYREFPAIAQLGAELGVARVWSDRVIPEGQSCRDDALTPLQTREYMELMAQAKEGAGKKSGTEVALKRALQFLVGGEPPYHCKAASRLIAVMPNGDVYPCRRLPVSAGNLESATLAEIWDGPALTAQRLALAQCADCSDCLYASLCRGGLRCLAYALSGGLERRDPGCWLVPD